MWRRPQDVGFSSGPPAPASGTLRLRGRLNGEPPGQEAVGAAWVQEQVPVARKSKVAQGPWAGGSQSQPGCRDQLPKIQGVGSLESQATPGEAAGESACLLRARKGEALTWNVRLCFRDTGGNDGTPGRRQAETLSRSGPLAACARPQATCPRRHQLTRAPGGRFQ